MSQDDGWDLFAAAITPLLIGALTLAQPFRRKVVNADRYYEPSEPQWETERVIFCLNCDGETWHTVLKFRYEGATSECAECGDVSDYEDDE